MIYKIELPTKEWETWRMLSTDDDLQKQIEKMQAYVFKHVKKFLLIVGDETDVKALQVVQDERGRQMATITTEMPNRPKKKRKARANFPKK